MKQDYVECPVCRTRYPWGRIYSGRRDLPIEDRAHYTRCSVCGCAFGYRISVKRRFLIGPKEATVSRPLLAEDPRPGWETKPGPA